MPNAAPAIRYQLGKLVGYVVSTKMNKSVSLSPATARAETDGDAHAPRSAVWQITVNIPWLYKHPKYERVVTRRTKVMAHDEYELCSEGDMVRASTHPPPPSARGVGSPPHVPLPDAGAIENEQAVKQEEGARCREDLAKGGRFAATQPVSDGHSVTWSGLRCVFF